MNESILNKLEHFSLRLEELNALLSEPDISSDVDKFKNLSIEHSQLIPICEKYEEYIKTTEDIETANLMASENDAEMKQMAQEELKTLKKDLATIELELKKLLLPKDPNDTHNAYLEIRAGTGGDEASIFSGDLYRMYAKYAENQNWKIETISSSLGDHGGFKEIIVKINGRDVYSKLKFESGAHRVQRVPETESQGRVHTSACTVAIMPEVENIEEIDIDINDVRVDTFRASGAGGQHVNKTDSAIRLTHIPSGIVAECQDDRSQHKNKAKALSLLAAKILDIEQQKQQSEQASMRKELVGSGDRSERIRTYNYPQGRVTDHRINLTLYKLVEIMEGDLNQIIEPLVVENQTQQLAELNQ